MSRGDRREAICTDDKDRAEFIRALTPNCNLVEINVSRRPSGDEERLSMQDASGVASKHLTSCGQAPPRASAVARTPHFPL